MNNSAITSLSLILKSLREKILARCSLSIVLLSLSGFMLLDGWYLYSRVPDWSIYAKGPIPKSRFIQHYLESRADHRDWPVLRWSPTPLSTIPKYLRRAVIVAEDSRFYDHNGFDLTAFREAMGQNLQKGKMAYGASTLSQQTVKNLFLSPSRDPLRKWHELVLTLVMEQRLSKSRILEIYLNIAEFGRGIYGVEAAAQYYFSKSVSSVTLAEAVELAASLPSPVKSNPTTRSSYFVRHRDTILARVTPRTVTPDTQALVSPTPELEAGPAPEEEEPRISAYESPPVVPDDVVPSEAITDHEGTPPSTAPDLPDTTAESDVTIFAAPVLEMPPSATPLEKIPPN